MGINWFLFRFSCLRSLLFFWVWMNITQRNPSSVERRAKKMPTLHPIEISLFYSSDTVEKRLQGSALYANPNLLLDDCKSGRIDINNNIYGLKHDND